MALSPEELDQLRKELLKPAYATLTDLERFEAIHAHPPIENPTPAPQVLGVFTAKQLIDAIAPTHRGPIAGYFGFIAPLIMSQDRRSLSGWLNVLVELGGLDATDAARIHEVIEATVPDPNWPKFIGGQSVKQVLFGDREWKARDGSAIDFIPLTDVEAAR